VTDPGGDPAAQVALNAALARGTLPITSVCNFACIFCSNHQNPPGVRTFRFPHRPLADIRRDIELLPRSGRVVVGEAATRIDEGEPLLHPDFDRILVDVRAARPQAELVVTTNGSLLDRPRIELIASLAPVSVNLSLNLVTAEARRHWLGDRHPEQAPEAAKLLSEHGIPWHGSLVGMDGKETEATGSPRAADWLCYGDSGSSQRLGGLPATGRSLPEDLLRQLREI
jgi:MoaA/NifB/PqqE/SkfB family radical SAM enzyme